MNWSDEHYVKLYTRESLTWRTWGWEARTTFLHLLKCVDHSGFIETGRMKPAEALAMQLFLPREIVAVGLEQLIASETVEIADHAILIVKFVEAQEAKKSEAQRKRDFRERTVLRRRALQTTETTTPHVPCLERGGTQMDSPALPCPAQPDLTTLSTKVDRGQLKPTKGAQEVFEYWAKVMKKPRSVFAGKRLKAVEARLRDGYSVDQLKTAIDRRSRTAFVNDKGVVFNDLELICRDASQVERETTTKPVRGSVIHNQTSWGPDDDALAGLSGEIP